MLLRFVRILCALWFFQCRGCRIFHCVILSWVIHPSLLSLSTCGCSSTSSCQLSSWHACRVSPGWRAKNKSWILKMQNPDLTRWCLAVSAKCLHRLTLCQPCARVLLIPILETYRIIKNFKTVVSQIRAKWYVVLSCVPRLTVRMGPSYHSLAVCFSSSGKCPFMAFVHFSTGSFAFSCWLVGDLCTFSTLIFS